MRQLASTVARNLCKVCVEPIILHGAEIRITRLNTQESTKRVDRILRLAGLAIAVCGKTASVETATTLAYITPLSELATGILPEVVPEVARREEALHRSPDASTYCMPPNFLRPELLQATNEERTNNTPAKRHLLNDRDVPGKTNEEDSLDQMREYIEKSDRRWKNVENLVSRKTQGGNEVRCAPVVCIHGSEDVTRASQVLSGHLPTLEYLRRRGQGRLSDQC